MDRDTRKDVLMRIKSSAMDVAGQGISIADVQQPDCPLIFVNAGFCAMTGYAEAEVLGKNCRFLQGAETNPQHVTNLRDAIRERKILQQEILNYRKDGIPFWNILSLTPVFDENGTATHIIGIQDDITFKKRNEAIELELANRVLTNRITLMVEEEQRQKIGGELHDNVSQLLAVANLYLNMALRSDMERKDLVQQSKDLLTNALSEIRKLSHSLEGPALNQSLKQEIGAMVEITKKAVPFQISFTCADVERISTEAQRLMLYRIIQEQLNNIIKYADCKNVTISITQKNGAYIDLVIQDDGVGFTPTKYTEGIGLKNIKNRVLIEHGTMALHTDAGKGCRIEISIPVAQ